LNNDLKDIILKTLEEIDNNQENITYQNEDKPRTSKTDDKFLLNLREKLLVLFEGLQSPEIVDIDQKLDLTLNFLEFTLSQLEKKLNE
jgi:hypothetical protein